MDDDDKPLFREKRIGFGLSPNRPGGWFIILVIIGAVAALTVALSLIPRH